MQIALPRRVGLVFEVFSTGFICDAEISIELWGGPDKLIARAKMRNRFI